MLPRPRFALALLCPVVLSAQTALDTFQKEIRPMLETYCYSCHGDGESEGGVTLDAFKDEASLKDHKLWLRVLKNTRSRIMPPVEEDYLEQAEIDKLAAFIKRDVFELDPARPDPGRVTVRRLNRVEYRNTVRELLGVDYDTQREFPADDTGHGFDNNGDVLTLSPMLLEKYLDAAQAVVAGTVPLQPRVVAERALEGRQFVTVRMETPATLLGDTARTSDAATAAPVPAPAFLRPAPAIEGRALDLSYYTPATVGTTHRVEIPGAYEVELNLNAVERYVDDQFDYNRCRVIFQVDGETVLDQEFVREGFKTYKLTFAREWAAGDHQLSLEIRPLGPDRDQKRSLRIRLNDVTVRGPFARDHWVQPANYARYFPRAVPADAAERAVYLRELLADFTLHAFRRPTDQPTIERLATMAERVAAQEDGTFEAGVAQAMVAVLASPRFIFREEETLPLTPGEAHPLVDEWALASRLSYFLWSSMPDAELFRLAAEGRLRANLTQQVDRMMADPKSDEFIRNFTGQWLQARDISTVIINPLDVFLRENPNPDFEQALETFRRLNRVPAEQRTAEQKDELTRIRDLVVPVFRAPKPQLTNSLREAMQQETEMSFAHVLREDRSLVELINADYTFLNEELAQHYGIAGVTGREMRKVQLPPDSPRGGVLTQGTVLAVTSNPTRTSPVKRGVFILEKILGTPAAPPPPNIPPLENVASKEELSKMTLRETLNLHARSAECRSCHNRMDPLGLALENFNALGRWRDMDSNQPVEAAGKLITGEKFADIRELKRILATGHRGDYLHNMAEKLLTYALGRGLDYTDVDILDQLVVQLEAADARPSALLHGIIRSAAFQQRRLDPPVHTAGPAAGPSTPRS
ncbi:hypothetical protein Verru16b_00075 [Lacunisphaera limnophila]|uniref:Planctomycete cytochrome C n=1 Tax=Lacunisphaera limnophila TaxID=1838286 RepID=A0A1I7PHF7_9BACT|nr:DUF1592 domain-containing protein [Lacunisphaera limnophila]AOS43037.1 hypothetical protein Verru16b_00075 [Lacunisphaera limnophila]